ncbi:MAG: glycosyltransferase [Candidatus Altiarchaeota archaeon]|nr:glycosyltransferase [Candidatus Altiarchaeota archaeon]
MDIVTGIHSISFFAYNTLLIPVTFFSLIYYITAFRSIMREDVESRHQPAGDCTWPKVTIQIPTYNEPVAIRCAESCLAFDYPQERFEILIGDDSTDPSVSDALDVFAKQHPGKVTVTRRGTNKGFKPGNLNHMLARSNGDIIVIFDSDFVAPKSFLKRVVAPFLRDDRIGGVQVEWDFLNEKKNHISKLSTTLLMFYYSLIVPINRKIGASFLFGSGEAVRKETLIKLGGWKEGSLTEDTEYSLRMMKSGYRVEYINDIKVYGEVPYRLKCLISQQRRWAYGNTSAFREHAKEILSSRLTLLQKVMITYTTSIGYLSNFFILLFIITGFIYFFSQPPAPIDIMEFIDQTGRSLIVTSGFIAGGFMALYKKNKQGMLLSSMASVVTFGLAVSVGVCEGFFKAALGREMVWSAIRKEGNVCFDASPDRR